MKTSQHYFVALFDSVTYVMKAEKILKEAGIPHKLIPVPRNISSDCGVCIRFLPEHSEALESTLMGKVETYTVRPL